MSSNTQPLIGRQREFNALTSAIASARKGEGSMLLVAGEAGAGKTSLVEAALAGAGVRSISGRAMVHTTPPFGPITAALRDYLRQVPQGLAHSTLSQYLPFILPELGTAPAGGDRNALIEAVRHAFETIANHQPVVVFIDDLQWADNATFEFLPRWAESLAELPMLVIATYRSDEIPRGHPVRQLRTELRRSRHLQELVIEPLDRQATAELAGRIFGNPVNPALATALFNRTQGIPLFIEELANALSTSRHIRAGKAGFELVPGHNVPIPETLRDAVLLRLDGLDALARKLLEIASVIGHEFDLTLVCDIAGDDSAIDALFERSWIIETSAGRAAFRHALTHEAIYNQIPWTRRRSWHRDVATRLAAQGAPPEVIAEHWLAVRELDLARQSLLEYAERSCSVHAYRDAAQAMLRALEIWPKNTDEEKRLMVLDRLGYCLQLSGKLNDAIQAWREAAERRQHDADPLMFAQLQRQLATAHEIQGTWEQAIVARQSAAVAYVQGGLHAEAVTDRLSIAAHLRSAGRFSAALELLIASHDDLEHSERWDLKARSMALEGNVRARMGEYDTGLLLVRTALALALDHNLSVPAAEVYQRMADVFEHAGDYASAKNTYQTAFDFCAMNGTLAAGQVCKACLTAVLFHTGEWDQAAAICRDVLASSDSPPHAMAVGNTILGLIHALRGQPSRARPLLLEGNALGRHIELAACELLSTWGFAWLDAIAGDHESAAGHSRSLLQRWQQIEERHYAIAPLVWITTHFALMKANAETRACANALATIASSAGQPEALSALAYALGEVAALEGDIEQAAQQFNQSLALLGNANSPLERIEAHTRAGNMQLALGYRKQAVEQLVSAFRAADKLGATPLAEQIARELAALGERMDQRVSRRMAVKMQHAGLTRRQIEILKLVAQGQTNVEIAHALTLSTRTVEMHVGDILARLDCHTRTEAVRKASELNLLKTP